MRQEVVTRRPPEAGILWRYTVHMEIRLRALRKAKGISQEALAECLGLTKMTISKYETGGTSPTIERLEQLARELDCSVADLLGFAAADQQEHALLRLFRDMAPEIRERFLGMAEALAAPQGRRQQ